MNKISKRNKFKVYTWGKNYGIHNPNDLIGYQQKEHRYTYCEVCDKLLPKIFYEIDNGGNWWFVCSENCINMCILQHI